MRKFLNRFGALYLSRRFFISILLLSALFVLIYALNAGEPGFLVAISVTALWIVAVLSDATLLFFRKDKLIGVRYVPENFSLGDDNAVTIKIRGTYNYPVDVEVIDELPKQLQKRDFNKSIKLVPGEPHTIRYEICPKERGVYEFGNVVAFVSFRALGFVQRRFNLAEHQEVKVFPSVLQMKQMELLALAQISTYQGVKKIRRIGHSYEFEQIKEYVEGDDYRSINWKATGRAGALMVNQYEDERSQPIYSVIDTSRNMKMPFNGLSLLDYAVNTSLVISNIALRKSDKAGLMTYSEKEGSFLKAENSGLQLQKIIRELYNVSQSKYESDYELLYYRIMKDVKRRSLLFLYLNFESTYAVERILPMLRKLNRKHLLVVVYFENSEILEFAKHEPKNLEGIYDQVVAEKHIYEKQLIAKELHSARIQTILTRPEDLSIKTVNKYLELKARGLI